MQQYPWNTMVLVSRVSVLLELFQTCTPALYTAWRPYWAVLGSTRESEVLHAVYATLPSVNFSQAILAQSTSRLGVMRVHGVHWSDWGTPQRILHDLACYALG
jgi:mannose-1-phosphate guanylyltransferase